MDKVATSTTANSTTDVAPNPAVTNPTWTVLPGNATPEQIRQVQEAQKSQPKLSKNGKKIGRPTKKQQALTEDGVHWVDKMVALYNDGLGDVEICRELKMPHRDFQKKLIDDPLFAQLVEFGRLARKGYWLEIGRKAAKTGAPPSAFNYWISFMKNEFGWSEKTELKDLSTPAGMGTDELRTRIAQISKKLKNVPASVEMQTLMTEH